MNHKFVSTTAKTIAVAATAAIMLIGNPVSSFAHDMKEKTVKRITDEQVSVQYIGVNDNNFIFNIQYENTSLQKFSVIVKDDDGVTVYQEQFTDAHFAKNFHLPKNEGTIHPTFIIRSGTQQVERSFEVSTKLTQNVVVTKL